MSPGGGAPPGAGLGICLLVVAMIGALLAFALPSGTDAVRFLLPAGGPLDPGRMFADSIMRLFLGFFTNLWWLFALAGFILIAMGGLLAGGGGRR